MSGFIENFKRGLEGDDSKQFAVADVQAKCPHCGGVEFDEGYAMLNTAGLTFLGLDWANREANLLICTNCGRVEWFLQEPKRV
jgi:predicted nucleic-acid-binding Zn-ribbon protein